MILNRQRGLLILIAFSCRFCFNVRDKCGVPGKLAEASPRSPPKLDWRVAHRWQHPIPTLLLLRVSQRVGDVGNGVLREMSVGSLAAPIRTFFSRVGFTSPLNKVENGTLESDRAPPPPPRTHIVRGEDGALRWPVSRHGGDRESTPWAHDELCTSYISLLLGLTCVVWKNKQRSPKISVHV